MDLSAMGLGLIDYAIFIVALVAVLMIGMKSGGKIKDLNDYALSKEKKFSTPVLAMTLIVTMIGSNSSIGAISEIYDKGLIPFTSMFSFALLGCFLLVQYASKFMARRYPQAISLYGIIEQEYGVLPAKFSSVISALLGLVGLSMQMIGMGYVAKTFLGIPFYLGTIGASIVFIIYSSFSGIRGVVYTDVLQFFIVLVVFPILVGVIIYNIGGLKNMFINLPHEKSMVVEHPDFKEYIYLSLFWIMPFGLLRAEFIQRILMCGDNKEIQKMGLSYVLFQAIFKLMVGLIGLSSIILLPSNLGGKEVIPMLMKNYLPIGLKGLAITAFLAVIMSTADSVLHAITVLLAEIRMNHTEREDQGKHDSTLKIGGKAKENKKGKGTRWIKATSMVLGLIALGFALLDFTFIKVFTIASAIAFTAVNIPIFFAPFKDRRQKAVKAYMGSVISGFSSFIILWLTLGQGKMYMVSFYATFFAIAGWFIGANFFDKIKTNFWARMWEAYKPKFNARPLLDSARGYVYFMIFSIVTFLLRFISNVWQPFVPGNFIISIVLLISCLLLLSLYFGDKIKATSYKLFIALWLATLFMVLPMYNMIAVLQHPDSMVEIVGLVMSILILNLILSWRLAALFLLIAFAISKYLNNNFYQHEAIFSNFEYLTLAAYVTIAGIIVTMILKKVYDNVATQKLEYADAMACSIAHELKSPIAHSGILLRARKVRTMEDVESLFQKMDKVQRSTSDVISRTVQLFTQGTSDRIVDEDVNVANLLMMVVVGTNYPRKDRERMIINVESDFVVKAYPNNLFTIVNNLIKNAYKYALKAKASAKLEIYSKGNKLIFRDTGPGISSDRLLTIFDKGVTYNPTGSGFGLYYCKIEMERLGGSISCESKEGEYTQFTLTFTKRLKIKEGTGSEAATEQ
jgi:Na+/proline symporter/signal transduction histidine kinase